MGVKVEIEGGDFGLGELAGDLKEPNTTQVGRGFAL